MIERRSGGLRHALLALMLAFVVTALAVSLLFNRGRVVGDFMAPVLLDGDAIVVERASGRFIDYRVGEVVSVRPPGSPRGHLLTRVVGTPGDLVLASGTTLRPLGADEFVVKDDFSRDGRLLLERADIEGRVLLRAWPLSRLQWRPGVEP